MSTLSIWTIYDRPADWPEWFVAREFVIGMRDDKAPEATDNLMMARVLEELRETLRGYGLTVIPRDEIDDAAIVESWL